MSISWCEGGEWGCIAKAFIGKKRQEETVKMTEEVVIPILRVETPLHEVSCPPNPSSLEGVSAEKAATSSLCSHSVCRRSRVVYLERTSAALFEGGFLIAVISSCPMHSHF